MSKILNFPGGYDKAWEDSKAQVRAIMGQLGVSEETTEKLVRLGKEVHEDLRNDAPKYLTMELNLPSSLSPEEVEQLKSDIAERLFNLMLMREGVVTKLWAEVVKLMIEKDKTSP